MTVDGVRIGVRTNHRRYTSILAAALSSIVTEEEADRANYSVHFATNPNQLHLLHWGGCAELRTPDPDRLLVALRRHLQPRPNADEPVVLVDSVAVLHGGQATLLPRSAAGLLTRYDRRLQVDGVVRLDARACAIDPVDRVLVVGGGHHLHQNAVADLKALLPPPRRRDQVVQAGRYPLARWCFAAHDEPEGTLDRAAATQHAARLVIEPQPDIDVVDRLTEMFRRTQALTVGEWNRSALEVVRAR